MSSDLQESTLELYFEVPYPTPPHKKNLGIDRYLLSSVLPHRHPWKTLNTQQKAKGEKVEKGKTNWQISHTPRIHLEEFMGNEIIIL